MSQPEWELVAYLGDVNPLDYGGLWVFRDKTGEHCPQVESIEPIGEDEDCEYEVHRMYLEKLKVYMDDEGNSYLIDAKYQEDWPHAPSMYQPWFCMQEGSLESICKSVGAPLDEMRENLCSEDPAVLALAYRDIAGYYGWANFDQYPDTISRPEAEERIKSHFDS